MIKKGDFFVILFFAVLAAAFSLFLFKADSGGKTLRIYSENKLYARYKFEEIKKEFFVDIKNSHGNMRVCISKDGAYVESSSCPDKICLRCKKLNKINQTAVCVPNRILLEIVPEKKLSGVDAVAY